MLTAMMSLVLVMADYEKAEFVLEVKANTEVAVYVGETRLVPGKVYRTKDRFIGTREVEVRVRFINGDTVIERHITLPLKSGEKNIWTIELDTNPPTLFLG
jgi:hypothetical protein